MLINQRVGRQKINAQQFLKLIHRFLAQNAQNLLLHFLKCENLPVFICLNGPSLGSLD